MEIAEALTEIVKVLRGLRRDMLTWFEEVVDAMIHQQGVFGNGGFIGEG